MTTARQWALLGILAAAPAAARAGDLPLYQPAPAWVIPAALPPEKSIDASGNALIDVQQRIEGGRLWSYADIARKIVTPELLAQNATLTLPWFPDKGDLIIHELSIVRGTETIDVLARGQKFTVLRREQALEQRELTGILSATLAVEGLQVGDIVRLRMSTTAKDDALGGRVQLTLPLLAQPLRLGAGDLRLSWPTAHPPHWKLLAANVATTTTRRGDFTEVALVLPVPKQPELPTDAPGRYQHVPLIEASTFADWADVSKTMAPLYATDGTIAEGSPLAAEVATIMRAQADPVARAAQALRLVQDKTRYLAVGMSGGNYIPQKPARTWEVRYGDCKAKTLLLLAMLHAMKIEAEPALASIGLGDLVADRLPSASAFNHILVRASIGPNTLWLDGTASGTRMADIFDTPVLGSVLPVRASGADLMKIVPRAPARAVAEVTIDADETASVDLPGVADVTAVLRGPGASQISLAASQLGAKEQRDAIGQFLQNYTGDAQWDMLTLASDPTAGAVTLKGRGVLTTSWHRDERKMKRWLSRVPDTVSFDPDRARPAWMAIPVTTPLPNVVHYTLRVRLPDGGRGYAIDGEPDTAARLAGYDVRRHVALNVGVVDVEETLATSGIEIPAADIPAERDRVATANARAPKVVAPADARRAWEVAGAPSGATQIKAIDAVYAHAIAIAEPDDTTSLTSRASFRSGIGDRRGAIADWTRVLAIAPTAETYLLRSHAEEVDGNLDSALADGEAARKLDPSSANSVDRVAWLRAKHGDLPGALALLDERIAVGGDTRPAYRLSKAGTLGAYGDPKLALAQLDALIEEKPGTPNLLNARCWVKATRQIMLDTALKDCTSAIELSNDTATILDSRAVVWLRLKRNEDALRDVDAALLQSPGLMPTHYVRGIVLTRLGRRDEAAKELALVHHALPSIEGDYARFDLKP